MQHFVVWDARQKERSHLDGECSCILTTLGCQPIPDRSPQSRNSRPEESLGRGLHGLSLQGWSISPQGVLRNLSTEEFLGSGVPGHPRVVSIQGWFLASPTVRHSLSKLRRGLAGTRMSSTLFGISGIISAPATERQCPLVAPCRAICRYYCRNTPYRTIVFFRDGSAQIDAIPPLSA